MLNAVNKISAKGRTPGRTLSSNLKLDPCLNERLVCTDVFSSAVYKYLSLLYLLYRVYQNEVHSFKNASNLKSMKVIVNIFFYLDSLIACLPPGARPLMCDNQ